MLLPLTEINGTVVLKWFRADLSSVWDSLTCYLPNPCMKHGLFNIYVATCFAVNNFRNT